MPVSKKLTVEYKSFLKKVIREDINLFIENFVNSIEEDLEYCENGSLEILSHYTKSGNPELFNFEKSEIETDDDEWTIYYYYENMSEFEESQENNKKKGC